MSLLPDSGANGETEDSSRVVQRGEHNPILTPMRFASLSELGTQPDGAMKAYPEGGRELSMNQPLDHRTRSSNTCIHTHSFNYTKSTSKHSSLSIAYCQYTCANGSSNGSFA